LHRQVDSYTDSQAIGRSSKSLVSSHKPRLAGVWIDLFYDRFLVKNWLEYSEIPVADFSLDVYKVLQDIGAVSQPVRDYAWN